MAITTLLTARTELESRGYSRFSDARLDNWLNQARLRFEDYPCDWPWLKATATGAAPLTVSDLRRVLSVADSTSQQPLAPLDPNTIIEFVDTTLTRAGTAAAWYLSSSTVVAAYPATASLSVRYVKFSPALSADGDTPLIPAEYRMDWVDIAEAFVLQYGVKDQAAASAMWAGTQARLAEIAGVFEMMDRPVFSETLVTGASVDS